MIDTPAQSNITSKCTVAVVGGGPSGLALATRLRAKGVDNVVVLEREPQAGGVPRHCGHYPFGVWEFKRLMKGPDYARALVAKARAAGVDIRTNTTVTALHPNARLSLSTAQGQMELHAERVVLCTGVRESSRAQRFISGTRPQGVITTGALQSMAYLHRLRPFRRAIILGTELVSFSALMTCKHIGIRPLAMIEANDRITVRRFMRPYPALKGVAVETGVTGLRILGQRTVEGIEYLDHRHNRQTIACDGIIISGNFRPESALLYASHIDIDQNTGGPSVDQFGRTSDPGYYATGNLLRPVETSAWCWQEAVECADRVLSDLTNPIGTPGFVALRPQDPAIRFVVPQRLTLTDRPDNRPAMVAAQLRLNHAASGHLTASSDGRTLWGDFLQSRPERRILAPLKPMLSSDLSVPVDLTIIRNT